MAVFTNPMYYEGPLPSLKKLQAAGSKTWQAGQFCRTTDSGVVPCKTAATSINGLFAKTQASATTAGDLVDVYIINSASTKFVIGVTSGTVDAKAGQVLIGSAEGLGVNSCICTLSLSNDTNEILKVHDVMGRVEPMKNDTNVAPGYAIVSVTASALDAEGAGL